MRRKTLRMTLQRDQIGAPTFTVNAEGDTIVTYAFTGAPTVRWVPVRGSRRDARRRHSRKMKRP